MNILKMELMGMDTNNKMKKLITHNGSFHSDDIFAAATLSLILERKGETFEIIRTRDEKTIEEGDYVFDVGGIYDENTNRFDHHQVTFKERREDDIIYSSFGLVWKKFGSELTGSEKSAKSIEKHLVAPIDAFDNGFDLVENKYDITPYYIQHFFMAMLPTWNENDLNKDEMFLKSVEMAKVVLSREIIHANDTILAEEKVKEIYKNSVNKKMIVLDEDYFFGNILDELPELLFVIYPKVDNSWGVRAVRKDLKTFENRKNFPSSWSGLRDEELQKITGVSDSMFCHRALFLSVAKSKEGAIKLAELALNSN